MGSFITNASAPRCLQEEPLPRQLQSRPTVSSRRAAASGCAFISKRDRTSSKRHIKSPNYGRRLSELCLSPWRCLYQWNYCFIHANSCVTNCGFKTASFFNIKPILWSSLHFSDWKQVLLFLFSWILIISLIKTFNWQRFSFYFFFFLLNSKCLTVTFLILHAKHWREAADFLPCSH